MQADSGVRKNSFTPDRKTVEDYVEQTDKSHYNAQSSIGVKIMEAKAQNIIFSSEAWAIGQIHLPRVRSIDQRSLSR